MKEYYLLFLIFLFTGCIVQQQNIKKAIVPEEEKIVIKKEIYTNISFLEKGKKLLESMSIDLFLSHIAKYNSAYPEEVKTLLTEYEVKLKNIYKQATDRKDATAMQFYFNNLCAINKPSNEAICDVAIFAFFQVRSRDHGSNFARLRCRRNPCSAPKNKVTSQI